MTREKVETVEGGHEEPELGTGKLEMTWVTYCIQLGTTWRQVKGQLGVTVVSGTCTGRLQLLNILQSLRRGLKGSTIPQQ